MFLLYLFQTTTFACLGIFMECFVYLLLLLWSTDKVHFAVINPSKSGQYATMKQHKTQTYFSSTHLVYFSVPLTGPKRSTSYKML